MNQVETIRAVQKMQDYIEDHKYDEINRPVIVKKTPAIVPGFYVILFNALGCGSSPAAF